MLISPFNLFRFLVALSGQVYAAHSPLTFHIFLFLFSFFVTVLLKAANKLKGKDCSWSLTVFYKQRNLEKRLTLDGNMIFIIYTSSRWWVTMKFLDWRLCATWCVMSCDQNIGPICGVVNNTRKFPETSALSPMETSHYQHPLYVVSSFSFLGMRKWSTAILRKSCTLSTTCECTFKMINSLFVINRSG